MALNRKHRLTNLISMAIAALSVFLILAALHFLSQKSFLRFDLTEDHEYTISSSTKAVLKNLPDRVTIKTYFSKKLPPAVLEITQSVQDLLEEYKTYAGDKMSIVAVNPDDSEQSQQEAQLMGIPPVQLNVIEKDERALSNVYLGLVILYLDKKEIIPVAANLATLEHDLTQAIFKVSLKELPEIAFHSGYPPGDPNNTYQVLQQLLARQFSIRPLDPLGPDPFKEKPDLVLMASPRELPDSFVSALDDYLASGGEAVLLLDTVEVDTRLAANPIHSGLDLWLDTKGIHVNHDLVMDPINAYATFSSSFISYQVPYPLWPRIIKQGFHNESMITANLESLVLPWTSSLAITVPEDSPLAVTTLAQSSPESVHQEEPFELNPSNLRRDTSETPTFYPLAVQLKGTLAKTWAAAKGSIPEQTTADAPAEKAAAQLIVVANSRFAQDGFFERFPENLVFLRNILDHLTFGDSLIGIRSRGSSHRPLILTEPIERRAIKYFNVLFMPLFLIIFGMAFNLWRRRRLAHKTRLWQREST